MDSNPIEQMMMPLYNTASFLVQANMSIDKGVAILKNYKNIQSDFENLIQQSIKRLT